MPNMHTNMIFVYLPTFPATTSRLNPSRMQGVKRRVSNLHKGRSSCKPQCCSGRLSVSSTDDVDHNKISLERCPLHCYLGHAKVKEKLDQMIREGREMEEEAILLSHAATAIRKQKKKVISGSTSSNHGRNHKNRLILMVAMEKCSLDPREDFRKSMVEMIRANRIEEPKDLRYLLDCYVSMNSNDFTRIILDAFNEVCTNLFLCSKCNY